MEDNLKKAVTEMLVLSLLSQEDMYAAQITHGLEASSHGVLNIQFPYSVLYRLISFGYIVEGCKKVAPDGRRRQYYQITQMGRNYKDQMVKFYKKFSSGIDLIIRGKGDDSGL